MRGKFIRFSLNVPELKDGELTREQENAINADFESKRGIYKFGDIEVAVLEKDDTFVICGEYVAQTTAMCKAMVKELKQEIRTSFGVKKVVDLMVGWGDKLF